MTKLEVRRMIQQVFVKQLDVHPLTFSIAHEMHRSNDSPITIIACWWIAYKFEEKDAYLTIHDLHDLFPTIVNPYNNAENLRNTERDVLERQNFCIPHKTHMRDIYNRLPTDSAALYHKWLLALQDYRVIHVFSAAHWVRILVPAIQRTSIAPELKLLSLSFKCRHRMRLGGSVPRITYRNPPFRVNTRKKATAILSLCIIDPFK